MLICRKINVGQRPPCCHCYVPLAIVDLVQATDAAPWVQTTMESFEDVIPAADAAAASVLPQTNLRLAERRLEAEW